MLPAARDLQILLVFFQHPKWFISIYIITYLVPKMLFPNYHDPVLFINFLAQAVAPAMSAKQTDILLHVFVNI